MQLTPSAQVVYPDWWSFATYAAAAKEADGTYSYRVTDLGASLTEIGALSGQTIGFTERAGIASLFGIARQIELAADVLTAADDEDNITSKMVSEAPYSRPLAVQNAAPQWKIVAEISYRAPDGSEVTTWGTGFFHNVLPSTAGAMRDEAFLQFQRMLAKRDEQKNTGGELLNIGRTYLIAI